MLEEIREKKTNVWTYALVGAAGLGMVFIGVPLFGNHGANPQLAAKVGEQSISVQQLNQVTANYQRQMPGFPREILQHQALEQLIRQLALSEHVAKSNLSYSDAQLYQDIKEQFKDNETYQRALAQAGRSVSEYEQTVRQQKAVENYYAILQDANIADDFLFEHFLTQTAKSYDFTSLRLPYDKAFASISIDEAQIAEFYQQHQSEYMSKEQVEIEYIILDSATLVDKETIDKSLIEKEKTSNQQRSANYVLFENATEAQSAYARLTSGQETMAQVADALKSGRFSGEVGELPLQKRGAGSVAAVDEALFALAKVGDISPVISTEYGAMILELQEIKGEEIDAQAALERLAREQGKALYLSKSEQAIDAAFSGQSLTQIADSLKLPIQTLRINEGEKNADTTWFNKPEVRQHLFGKEALELNKVADPVEIAEGKSVFYQVRARQLPVELSFAEVAETVAHDWQTMQAEKLLAEQAETALKTWSEGLDTAKVAEMYQAKVESYQNINRYNTEQAQSVELLERLLGQTERYQTSIETNRDYRITRLDAIYPADINKIDTSLRELLKAQWQQIQRNILLDHLAEYLQQHEKVQIYQNNINQ